MGESFDDAVARQRSSFFIDLEAAVNHGKLTLEPGQRFWICDESGGVLTICQTPRIVGTT